MYSEKYKVRLEDFSLALVLVVYIYNDKGNLETLGDYSSDEAKAKVEAGKYPTEVYLGVLTCIRVTCLIFIWYDKINTRACI